LWPWLVGWLMHEEAESSDLLPLAVAVPIFCYSLNQKDGSYGIATITACAVLILYQGYLPVRGRLAAWCNYLGEVSYPLYLVHIVAFTTLWMVLAQKPAPTLAAAVALLSAVVLYAAIDRPLRARARGRRHAARPVAATVVEDTGAAMGGLAASGLVTR
jgi:peptidoglycan/LPS O-acetylase OafA/YrhL